MTNRPAAEPLPPPRRSDTTYRIAVVCLGNICRSPMADVILNQRLADAGLGDAVEVVSAGTGDWHVGNPMDRRAAATLTAHGYDATRHRAQQITGDWLDEYDLILAMDASNRTDIAALGPAEPRVRMFRDFDPVAADGDLDVPDPYYGADDGFDTVLAMVERTVAAIVRALPQVLGPETRV